MQVVVSNIEKTIVVYGLALIFHTFIYTLLTHISYFLVRSNAHGAHAKSSLLCHIQNLLFFNSALVLTLFHISNFVLIGVGLISLFIVIKFAPAATRKQPIPKHLIKRKWLTSIMVSILLLIVCIFIKRPLVQLVVWGCFRIADPITYFLLRRMYENDANFRFII